MTTTDTQDRSLPRGEARPADAREAAAAASPAPSSEQIEHLADCERAYADAQAELAVVQSRFIEVRDQTQQQMRELERRHQAASIEVNTASHAFSQTAIRLGRAREAIARK